MSIASNTFLLFVLICVIVYYIVPGRLQWVVLLLFSCIYYLWGGLQYLFYILFSTAVTYCTALLVDRWRENGRSLRSRRALTAAGLLGCFGMLAVVKYLGAVFEGLNQLLHLGLPSIGLLFPLGISFYTFQSSGYLLDVYWEKVPAERNPFRYALFVSFFPQLLQGPISRYEELAHQLYASHSFAWNNLVLGAERILWGFFKKIVLSDWAGVFADAIYGDMEAFSGLGAFALLFYGIQLYADFSGGIDVVIGIARMLDISLTENFKRPYLATSVSNFWKRWHITLGKWMMTYVFYPISLSRPMMGFGKWCKRAFGKKTGRIVPVAVSELIIFFLVGIWHGASWRFVLYGIANGVIIAFSELMADNYRRMKAALHISGKEGWYHVFTIVRTFVIVNILFVLDRASGIPQALRMLQLSFTSFQPSQLLQIRAGREGTAFTPYALAILSGGCLLMVAAGVLEERGIDLRKRINSLPLAVSAGIWLILLLSIGFLGCTAAPRGFIYAQF